MPGLIRIQSFEGGLGSDGAHALREPRELRFDSRLTKRQQLYIPVSACSFSTETS